MVTFEPDLEQVFELPVLRDVAWREMAVVIEDRLRLRELVIEPPCRLRAEQEVIVDEGSWCVHGNQRARRAILRNSAGVVFSAFRKAMKKVLMFG